MRYIVVQWKLEDSHYGMAMKVLASSHPRFVVDSRFDFGLMTIASRQGFTITVLPSDEIYQPD